MLDKQDIVLLKEILNESLDTRFDQFEKTMDDKLDIRFAQFEKTMDDKLDIRFAQFEKTMDDKLDIRFAHFEKTMDDKLDIRFAQFEKTMDDKLDIRFAQSENLVLGEMERIRVLTDQRIDQLQANLEELKQYYRITKLENDNTALLLRMINDLQNRVEQLERKTA